MINFNFTLSLRLFICSKYKMKDLSDFTDMPILYFLPNSCKMYQHVIHFTIKTKFYYKCKFANYFMVHVLRIIYWSLRNILEVTISIFITLFCCKIIVMLILYQSSSESQRIYDNFLHTYPFKNNNKEKNSGNYCSSNLPFSLDAKYISKRKTEKCFVGVTIFTWDKNVHLLVMKGT